MLAAAAGLLGRGLDRRIPCSEFYWCRDLAPDDGTQFSDVIVPDIQRRGVHIQAAYGWLPVLSLLYTSGETESFFYSVTFNCIRFISLFVANSSFKWKILLCF